MKILEYPFDNKNIMLHKKQIKKELLEKNNFIEKKIAILNGATVNEVKNVLEIFLLNYGIKPIFYESEYNKYYEEGYFENKNLEEFKPDIIYIFTTFRNIIYDFDVTTSEEQINSKLDYEYNKYKNIWENIKNKYKSVIIQNNFEYPNYRLLGNKDITNIHGLSNFLHRLNNKIYEYENMNKNFFVCDINYVAAMYGLDNWHNEKLYSLYKMPFDINAIPLLSYNVANIIKSLYGKNKKALMLDLDNTLWGGVISEDGLEGIQIGKETAEGELYFSFQEYLKKLKSVGAILNVVSKNDEEIAIEGIEKSDGVLKKEDFVSIIANWDNKADNIKNLSNNLSLGTESFVFIDDNPMERNIVEENVSEISVPNVEAVEDYIKAIDRGGYFEVTNITNEDIKKSEMYKQNYQRETEKCNFTNYEEYLDSLKMIAEIKPFEKMYYDRISQLSNKSNQFNLTTKRYTIEDIIERGENNKYITLYGKLKDKFGEYGIVSLLIGERKEKELNIELLLMSCRVLKRDMEYAMMDALVETCKKNGIEKINGYYYKTNKNSMVKNLFFDFGFKKINENEKEDSTWLFDDLNNYKNKNKHIEIIK